MNMRGRAGFSLIEVMCAILILGIGLVGLTQGMTAALTSSKESEIQTSAALLAAGQIEALRAEPYIDSGETEGDCGEGLSLYRWKQTVTTTSIDGLYDVEVTIENSKSGQSIFNLHTLLFDPPIPSLDSTTDKSRSEKSKKRERSKL
jgi:prepilin-type N-terminal cleavage/methylation domain-containing protein